MTSLITNEGVAMELESNVKELCHVREGGDSLKTSVVSL